MKFRREAYVFVLVGSVATLLDFSTYLSLNHLGLSRDLSKFISFIVGTSLGYFGNTKFTFHNMNPKPVRYLLVYITSMILNVWINSLLFNLLENRIYAWIIATACSTTFNFAGLRYLAFSQKV